MSRHLRFVSRTLMVKDGDVEWAYKTLTRLLSKDGIIETVNRKRFFEKPCVERRRKNYESCRRIYQTEMHRKVAFVSMKNREDPWLGC
ncbi:small ribosomal subunit protein bS21m [Cottoperca gobio]|uniref:Small ribosomal subunit protein bS21m n=1 Tax=Cottoperca gobio TaxID=56716 RepID=A0A6J2QP00_COTGO|nr:28S ribosomal protein S21, mitochondrial [Cottoperca gobio]